MSYHLNMMNVMVNQMESKMKMAEIRALGVGDKIRLLTNNEIAEVIESGKWAIVVKWSNGYTETLYLEASRSLLWYCERVS